MRNPTTRRFVAAALFVWALVAVDASAPKYWHVATQSDLLKGDVESLSIDGDGRLTLGPTTELLSDTAAPFIWSLAAGPGGAYWAGTGNEGKVLRLDGSGRLTTVFDAAELEVHAVAPAPGDAFFAASSPDGKVYRVAADGAATVVYDPDDKYLWTMVADPAGTLYVGAGDKGLLHRVTADGKGGRFYDTKAAHVIALALDRDGQVLAGTESPGRLFRISREGKGFVLIDSPFVEMRALLVGPDGTIYAAAVGGRPVADSRAVDRVTAESARPSVPSVSTEITSMSIGDVQVATQGPVTTTRPDDRELKGAVYRVRPDGLWDIVWQSADDSPYSLAFDQAGRVLVGTGPKGKIYRLGETPGAATLVARAAAQQVTALVADPSGTIIVATANPGRLYRLSAGQARQGSYESSVRDASTVARWGTLSWRAALPAGTEIQVFTRSGNTAQPDDAWSDWSVPYKDAAGEAITSPNARYLQWKAVLRGRGATPVLTSVTVAYLERNLRPRVSAITVHPPGVVFQRPFASGEIELAGFDQRLPEGRPPGSRPAGSLSGAAPQLGRRLYQKGFQTFVWKAEDENGDELQYDVLYHAEGVGAWAPLQRGLQDPILVWDTSSVPDGTYVIRVVASDAPANSPGTALSGELESAAFEIDNTAPAVAVTAVQRDGPRTLATITVQDRHSPVQKVEYSLDASRWRPIYPKDGIPDSRVEVFEIALEGDLAAGRPLTIRAVDAMGNVGTTVADLRASAAGGR
jgi:hypothetical protein